ncbi:MAG: GNAT family N-acetyltransferase [Actinomycetota bacterium]
MRVKKIDDVPTFAELTAPVIGRDPAANNLVLGIVQALLDRPDPYADASCWVVEHDGVSVGAAIRTPPYNAVVADPLHDEAIAALADRLMTDDPDLPGVTANTPWVSRFAECWTAASGSTARTAVAQGVYALISVQQPRPTGGGSRAATADDRPLLERWIHEFEREALTAIVRDEHGTKRAIEARLGAGEGGGFTFWQDGGREVSLTGWTRITGGARIGPVYTPATERGRGYASNLVAEVSAQMLALSAEACFLYTDLGNPTSNGIYRAIGYEQVAESLMIAFDR